MNQNVTVGIDIEQIYQSKIGTKIVNTFNSATAETFRTKRGHLAMLVRPDLLERAVTQFGLVITGELDGLKQLALPSVH